MEPTAVAEALYSLRKKFPNVTAVTIHTDSSYVFKTARRVTLRGARRILGTAPVRKRALTIENLRAMVRTLPKNRVGLRNRAILLIGFAAALRRSEIAALRVEDIDIGQHGMRLDLRRSKTDQEERARACSFRAARLSVQSERFLIGSGFQA